MQALQEFYPTDGFSAAPAVFLGSTELKKACRASCRARAACVHCISHSLVSNFAISSWFAMVYFKTGRYFCMRLAAAQLAMVPPISHVLLFRVRNNSCPDSLVVRVALY
jgi:hypothetical protein